jgi:transcriptional regulator of acetoin/glycerol metabolism
MDSTLNVQREHHVPPAEFFREVLQASTQSVVDVMRTLEDRLTAVWLEAPCHSPQLSLAEVDRIHILRVLELCGGNRLLAARALGIGKTTLYRFLRRNVER